MLITREMLVKRLSEESGYWQKDVRALLQCMDKVIFDELCKVEPDEDVSIQIIQGAKFAIKVVPQRERVDPRDRKPIVCRPTVKVACKFSQDMKERLQEHYDGKHDG